jgi:hypothetical protein
MKSETLITAYVGAYPGGRAAPDLSRVPVSTDPYVTFAFALSFARDQDRDGVFLPVWDQQITPDLIAALKRDGGRSFFASLGGGDNFPWVRPSNEQAWIQNAVSSLSSLRNTYHLDGFDINYEQGLDDSFVPVMSQVIRAMNDYPNFPPRFSTNFTLAPFGATYNTYQQLYEANTTYIPLFNYQIYAEGIEGQGVQGYLNRYAQLAQANPNRELNGYREIGLGIASSTSAPRGLQPPDIFTVWDNLHSQGAASAFIWCLEDSVETNYAIERELLRRS